TSRRYATTSHVMMTAVLKYICGQSRRGLPVCSKYASTRWRSSRMNRSLRLNFSLAGVMERSFTKGELSVGKRDIRSKTRLLEEDKGRGVTPSVVYRERVDHSFGRSIIHPIIRIFGRFRE